MLEFVNFINGGGGEGGGTCVHRRILDAISRVLSNLLMSKLTDTLCLFGDVYRTARVF